MAIPDPHALPETEHDCQEYLHEADAAWDGGNSDHAYDLYHSLWASTVASEHLRSHAAYRLGLIAQTRGELDHALQFFSGSREPGAADAVHALTNATTNDPTPDPTVIPATAEQLDAWLSAGFQAGQNGQWERCRDFMLIATQAASITPSQIGSCYYNAGLAAEHLGDMESAVRFLEAAIPMMATESDAADARARLHAIGGAAVGATGTTPSEVQVAAGINAYENGDAHAARTALQAALHLEGPDDQKGRARYYLAVMDYQAQHFADARNGIEAAIADAPEPEKSWASAMLEWRWDEHPAAHGSAAGTGTTAPAPAATTGEAIPPNPY